MTLRRNFARFVQQLLDATRRDMEVLGDPFRPAGSSGHGNPSPRLCPAPSCLPQKRDQFSQSLESLNALDQQLRVRQRPHEVVGGLDLKAGCPFLGQQTEFSSCHCNCVRACRTSNQGHLGLLVGNGGYMSAIFLRVFLGFMLPEKTVATISFSSDSGRSLFFSSWTPQLNVKRFLVFASG